MSDLISKRELYRKLGEAYNKGCLTWGADEVIKDIIGECDSMDKIEALIHDISAALTSIMDSEDSIYHLHFENQYKMAKWPERYKELFFGTGLDLEELLAEAAQHVMQCDNCKMKKECHKRPTDSCRGMWLNYLKGGKDGKKDIKE